MNSAPASLRTPETQEDFEVRELTHADVAEWYHVYSTRSHPETWAGSFAEGWGDTRFAPVLNEAGLPVPTYYVASTPEAAYMESILHDMPLSPPGIFEVAALRYFHLVRLRLPSSLRYVSFHTPYLPRLGVTRSALIDSLPGCYARTRRWSQAAYLQCADAQALGYGSKRDDSARCMMLFRQRLPDPPFEIMADESLAVGMRRAEVMALVRSLRLHEV